MREKSLRRILPARREDRLDLLLQSYQRHAHILIGAHRFHCALYDLPGRIVAAHGIYSYLDPFTH